MTGGTAGLRRDGRCTLTTFVDYRRTFLAGALAVLVAAAPAAACLAMASEAPLAEHAPTDCDSSPDAPSATLCAISGTVVPTGGLTAPPPLAVGYVAVSRPGEVLALDRSDPAPTPRARSAPIHLLHATFLI